MGDQATITSFDIQVAKHTSKYVYIHKLGLLSAWGRHFYLLTAIVIAEAHI